MHTNKFVIQSLFIFARAKAASLSPCTSRNCSELNKRDIHLIPYLWILEIVFLIILNAYLTTHTWLQGLGVLLLHYNRGQHYSPSHVHPREDC